MNKLSNILWKIFTSIVVFFCRPQNEACADEYAQRHTLCRAGYYVSKCGDHNVGTNWLKGYPESTNRVAIQAMTEAQATNVVVSRAGVRNNLISGAVNSPNYYDYSGENNLKNLRYFFSADENLDIIYTTSSGTRQVATSTQYIPKRNDLLTATCNPVEVQIVCSKCPGVAAVPASTVDITYDSGLLVSGSWNFHTVADCYMREFADSTGIYEYVDSNNDTQNCYYANDVAGDVLVQENTATNSQYEE